MQTSLSGYLIDNDNHSVKAAYTGVMVGGAIFGLGGGKATPAETGVDATRA